MTVAERQRGLELAYRYIARRERTVGEVRRHLLGREIDEGSAEAVIEELTEQGSLDDARFARLFVEDKRELEQWGSERIRRGLQARGIERELAEEVLAFDQSDPAEAGDHERAVALLRQRFPVPPAGRRERERALGMLLRKGYEPDLAIDALRAYRGDGD